MNYFSPVIIMMAASQGIMNFSFFFWAGFLVLSLLLGRAMCGWICPLGAMQEIKDRAVPKPLPDYPHLRPLKFGLTFAWLGALIALAVIGGGYTTVDLLFFTESGVSIDRAEGWIIYGIIAGIVLVPAFFVGQRGFCHYFCPWGALNMAGTWAKRKLRLWSLHLVAESEKCAQCGTCSRNCPMSLPVQLMVERRDMYNRECIYCGTCVDMCPQNVIHYRWGRPPALTLVQTQGEVDKGL
jgi:polyferredoxin